MNTEIQEVLDEDTKEKLKALPRPAAKATGAWPSEIASKEYVAPGVVVSSFQCRVCKRAFAEERGRNHHESRVHGIRGPNYKYFTSEAVKRRKDGKAGKASGVAAPKPARTWAALAALPGITVTEENGEIVLRYTLTREYRLKDLNELDNALRAYKGVGELCD